MRDSTERFIGQLLEEWRRNSDRSCVIVAASIIDELLGRIIRARLVPNDSSQDTLFDGPNSPLGSFSARIDLAYRIALISPQLARDLHIIRRLRNRFAHSIDSCSFEDVGVRDQVEELFRSLNLVKRSPDPLTPIEDTTKGHFGWVATALITYLHRDVIEWRSVSALQPASLDWVYQGKFSFAGRA
jgi:DNA-binding MltR family transcriptional regulator